MATDLHALKLSHFSDVRIEKVDPLKTGHPLHVAYKPYGFWVSVDGEDDWESWCVAEGFRVAHLAIRHRVTLAADAKVLHIGSLPEIDAFADEYGVERQGFHLRGLPREIDWPSVAAKYDGIIIAPYQFARRLADGFSWYYGWDCASGCIWNPHAIASIEVIADLLREAA